MLETASASRGAVLDNQEVSDLPLEGRTITLLATVETGVQYTNTTPSSSARPFDNGLIENIQVNGGRSARNNYLLNGISNTAFLSHHFVYEDTVLEAPPDAVGVAVRKFQTSEVDAQYTKYTAGGIIDASRLRVVGNQPGFMERNYFKRSDVLNANSERNNKNGIARLALLCGNNPVLKSMDLSSIPHLYNWPEQDLFHGCVGTHHRRRSESDYIHRADHGRAGGKYFSTRYD